MPRDPSKAIAPWEETLDEPMEARVERCKADIANFKLGWRFSPTKPSDDMQFGRTDTDWINCVSVYPWEKGGVIDLESPKFREKLARAAFHSLLPSKPPKHPLRNYEDQNKLEDALCEACLPELLGIVDKIIERLKVALDKKEIQANNHRLRLKALVQPLREALQNGVTVDEVTQLLATISQEPQRPKQSLEELLNEVGKNLAQRQKTA